MKKRSLFVTLIFTALMALCTTVLTVSAEPSPSSRYPISGKPSSEFAEFDTAFVRLLKRWHIPGAAVAMMKDDKIVYARGYGWANKERRQAVMPSSLFRIASVSKAVTAVAILKLAEQHKLSLNDKVFDILNDIKPFKGFTFNKGVRAITIKNLLQMSSGWFARGKKHYDPMFGPWSKRLVKIIGYDNLPANCLNTTRMMLSMPLSQSPGKQYAYSNLDYCLLGLVINKVTGTPYGYQGYEHYVQSEVLKPIKIDDMYIGSTNATKRHKKEVRYYAYQKSLNLKDHGSPHYLPYSQIELLQKNYANGGWVASVLDLVKFAHEVNDGDVLDQKTLRAMLRKPSHVEADSEKYYAMGWKVKKLHGKKFWYQTGSFTGTNAILINRSDGTSIAVAFNSRPPVYHLWQHFRPSLKKILRTSDASKVLDTMNDLRSIA